MAVAGWQQLKAHKDDGAVVSFKDQHGLHFSVWRPGLVGDALKACCAAAEAYEPSAKVIAISTAQTILTDLRGRPIRHGRAALQEGMLLRRHGLERFLHPSIDERQDERWGR